MNDARTDSHESARSQEQECGLSAVQLAAIALLTSGMGYAATAEGVGVDVSTLYRWRRDALFAAELKTQLDCARDGAATQLLALVGSALDALKSVLKGQSEAARVAAARAVLDRVGVHLDHGASRSAAGSGSDVGCEELPDDELLARVRRLIFSELAGRPDDEVLATIRGTLQGADR